MSAKYPHWLTPLPPCPCSETYHKFPKIRCFLHENVRTSATEKPPPLVRKVSALDKPPLTADGFNGQPLTLYFNPVYGECLVSYWEPSVKDFCTKSRKKLTSSPLVRKMSALVQLLPLVRADTA